MNMIVSLDQYYGVLHQIVKVGDTVFTLHRVESLVKVNAMGIVNAQVIMKKSLTCGLDNEDKVIKNLPR